MVAEIRDDNGNLVGLVNLERKTFSTGSVGYNGSGKVFVGGKKHQMSLNLVEVGSKPK